MPKLVVKTELNTDGFEKQYNELEKKYENKEIDISITSKELEKEQSALDKLNEKAYELDNKYSEITKKIKEQKQIMASASYEKEPGVFAITDFENYNKARRKIELLQADLRSIREQNASITPEIEKQEIKVAKINGKLDKQKNDLNEIQGKINNMQVQQVQENIGKISAGIKGVVKNVVKWGLAVFSIRSAYMLVRNAINAIAQNDEQLKADIDYMKNAMAYVLEPIVRKIVEWAKQLVFYIGYIIKAWTGHDIFAKANKNVKKTVGGVKELKKQLAGFDEMNVLSDNGGTESGGVVGPSFNFDDMQVPKWVEEISKLLDYFNDPTWENFGRVIQGLGVIVLGLGVAFLSLPATITGAIILIIGTMMRYWEEIKTFINDKIFAWLDEKIENLSKTTIGKFFATFLEETKRVISDVVHILDGLFKGIRQIFDGIILIFRGQFKEGIISILKGLLNAVISALNLLIAGLNTLVAPLRAIIVGFGKIAGQNWSMENIRIPKINYLAKGGIVNMPGRGVPIGSAIAGERSQEGVIPLTDSQQMALLGEAIGKYITINASITNTMNGRVISKELQKINAENDFAFNR